MTCGLRQLIGVDAFRSNLMAYLQKCVFDFPPRPGDRHAGTPRWRLFAALLTLAEDPDASDLAGFAHGVAIGVGVQMPRLPSIYKRKTKWRLEAQRASEVHVEEASGDAIWMDNFRLATAVLPALRKNFDEDVKLGRMIKMSSEDVMSKKGSRLRIACLGASVKGTDDHGEIVVRILHDGPRGVDVNTRMKVGDRDPGPLAADVKRVLRAQADHPEPFKDLIVDVEGAHRLIPAREKDWGLQACTPEGESDTHTREHSGHIRDRKRVLLVVKSRQRTRASHALRCCSQGAPLALACCRRLVRNVCTSELRDSALVFAAVLDFTLSWHKKNTAEAVKWCRTSSAKAQFVSILWKKALMDYLLSPASSTGIALFSLHSTDSLPSSQIEGPLDRCLLSFAWHCLTWLTRFLFGGT